jgi:hypothetical protein
MLSFEKIPFEMIQNAPDEIFINLNDEQKSKILSHKAYILIEIDRSGLLSMDLLGKVIKIALKEDLVIGYMCILGQIIFMKEIFKDDFLDSVLEPDDLLSMFMSIQLVSRATGFLGKKKYWVHTHGLEQFALPDIQINDVAAKKLDVAYEWIYGVALHSMNNNVEIKPGEIFDFGNHILEVIPANENDVKDHYNSEVVELKVV